jgi:hypothetical protein
MQRGVNPVGVATRNHASLPALRAISSATFSGGRNSSGIRFHLVILGGDLSEGEHGSVTFPEATYQPTGVEPNEVR